MFGGGSNSSGSKTESDIRGEGKSPSPDSSPGSSAATSIKTTDQAASGEKRSGNGSPPGRNDNGANADKKRRSSGVGSKASSLLASAKNSLSFGQGGRGNSDLSAQTPLQKLGKQDPALAVPQGQHNNSAGESVPGPKSTFRVGVWEDRNKKCRRTMEDTHAFLYNFLDTPEPATEAGDKAAKTEKDAADTAEREIVQSDNGYFAIFDGHAGTFAADWCGKKLHIILEDMIRKNPNVAVPELLDQTFTAVDAQLEKLPLKNSGCTAAIAVLRWEDRVPSDRSVTGSLPIAPAAAAAAAKAANKAAAKANEHAQSEKDKEKEKEATTTVTEVDPRPSTDAAHARLKSSASRQRVLYTANVGDARIILCRGGRALRLSYDHKGSDENEGRRIANAGGLILNNRVNGVLAVTRALGDAYMKDLVTGHPYTTETVIQPDLDEFIIIACDGLWDVCSDQEAVDLVRNMQDPIAASKLLVDHALSRFSTDNLSCMIVRFDKEAASQNQSSKETGETAAASLVSEADKIVMDTKQKIADGSTPPLGVSASNSGRGYDAVGSEEADFVPTTLDGTLEEEPHSIGEEDSPEVTPSPGNDPVHKQAADS
ncbi:Protein-serine/threonine phosphatase [Purpureocillium takamizusanense]|uniref:Protein-serine/threonine phosphatase n=1 Tax=Purpureocillium takamizusanense TaxID=2060973 RepID=A0A9Q8QE08_9HYPO|nr:Protein-serine/threonine phosphatase [Purpureocillium takamizusanense]UNI17234.1 Protein-serine/threonine phosphatase [Purpureocillium takamizusanense]